MLELQGSPQLIGAIEIITLILSVVALIITVVGFFASLKFYRDGVTLQGKANDALTKLEEKTQFIQTQVGGMFDKTLEAAIGRKEVLSESFKELNEELELTKSRIVEQIGDAGGQEQKRLTEIVDAQMNLIREKVQTAKESAEDVNQDLKFEPLTLGEWLILQKLGREKKELQAWEAGRGIPDMSASRALYFLLRLKDRGLVYQNNGKHSLSREGRRFFGNIDEE